MIMDDGENSPVRHGRPSGKFVSFDLASLTLSHYYVNKKYLFRLAPTPGPYLRQGDIRNPALKRATTVLEF